MRFVYTLAVIILIGMLFYEIYNAIRSLRAARWKSTSGKLTRWNMHYGVDGRATTIVIRELVYVYSVSGKDYESARIGFGFPTWMNVLYLEETLKLLLKSAPDVTVFFDPKDPQRSVLSVGVQLHHLFKFLLLLLCFFAVGVIGYG